MFHSGLMIKKLIGQARKGTRMVTKVRVRTRVLEHVTGDLHPHGHKSPDVLHHSTQTFFTFRFNLRSDHRTSGAETTELVDAASNVIQMWIL